MGSGVWTLVAMKFAVHLGTTSLGLHRDELYFIAASKRLSASYVDFQPVVPLVVRAARAAFGGSLYGLRLIPSLAAAATVLLAALLARELGGGRRAQLLAAFAAAVVPLFVGMFTLLATVSLETPAWLLVALLVVRLSRTDDPRWWVLLGGAIGLTLLVKFTVLAYLLGLGIAVLATPLRRHLRTPWPWAGAAVALVLVAPSLAWQAANGFPVVEFVSNQGGGGAVLGLRGRAGFLASLLILPGPVALVLLVPGMWTLLRRVDVRVLGLTHAVAFGVFLVAAGKGYYAAPGLAVLLAAGAVALAERWRSLRGLVVALGISLVIALPLFPGVLPVSVLRDVPALAEATETGERLGWEDLARTVADAYGRLEPAERQRAVVVTRNYAQAAAVEFHAQQLGLPAAVSGHNSAYLWWPPIPRDHVAVVVGFDADFLRDLYADVERAATIRNRLGVRNYEWGEPVWIARGPKVSPAELREAVKLFTA